MKIKKEYTFSNKRQIWRIIPTGTDKLIIEEREPEKKEVFFNCVNIKTGKEIFKNLQLEEKFWIGIETVHNDIIYFHKYAKPDMPGHVGITAFDINSKKILWENQDYNFLFIKDEEIFCYRENFDGRNYYILNSINGELKEELTNTDRINFYRKNTNQIEADKKYKFPKQFSYESETDEPIINILVEIKSKHMGLGKIEYVRFDNLLLFNFHSALLGGEDLKNIFKVIDIDSGKVIFEEELNDGLKAFVPDSFFMKDNFIFILKGKKKLLVCSVNN